MSEALVIERTTDLWTFTLNRPDKRNALSAELVEALISGLEDACQQQIALLVLRGNGKNFSAGFDFGDFETQSEGDLALRFIRIEQLLQRIASMPALTIGIAHGRNFGAGVDLLAACKIRACTPDASFQMPGLKFGLILGTRRFRHLVGAGHATRILSAARAFSAAQATEIGFVQHTAEMEEMPALLRSIEQETALLDAPTRRELYQALNTDDADKDLAALVRSASRPGLKERIRNYLT